MNKLTTITDRERALERELATLTEIYGVACRQREELAATVKIMRDALAICKFDSLNMDAADMEQIRVAFAMKTDCSDILRQRDARTLRQAASRFSRTGPSLCVGNSLDAMADELAPRTLRTTEVSNG
jgi:hypothetical protein